MKAKIMLFTILVAVGFVSSAAAAPPARASGNGIAPSGDTTGETDADTIETALRNCPPGGTVTLDSGLFYVSRDIVVEDFSGTLEGQGMDPPNGTTILAVRNGNQPFDGLYKATYSGARAPSILLFEYPYGGDVYDLTVRNMTLEVDDPSPEPGGFSWAGSALFNLLAVWGGNCNTTLEGVRFKGAPSTAPGNQGGKNVLIGAHIMLGKPPQKPENYGKGNVIMTGCEAENTKYGLVAMTIRDSTIEEWDNVGTSCRWTFANANTDNSTEYLHDNTARACEGDGFDLAAFTGGHLTVADNTIAMNKSVAQNNPYSSGIWLASVANADITGNHVTGGGTSYGIISVMRYWGFSDSVNIQIDHNTLVGDGDPYGIHVYPTKGDVPSGGHTIKSNILQHLDGASAGIYIGPETASPLSEDNTITSNDYSASDLPGWSLDGGVLQGAGCLELADPTAGNQVNESVGAGSTFPTGTDMCTQIADLTDDPTTADYDGTNKITGYQSCVNSN